MDVGNLDEREPFTTLDGSTIREIAGRADAAVEDQSLAEATVPAGGATTRTSTGSSEELYFFTAGAAADGRRRVADVGPGDCAVLPPGTEHKLENPGAEPLVLLCCCSPPYAHEDTVLTEEPVTRS